MVWAIVFCGQFSFEPKKKERKKPYSCAALGRSVVVWQSWDLFTKLVCSNTAVWPSPVVHRFLCGGNLVGHSTIPSPTEHFALVVWLLSYLSLSVCLTNERLWWTERWRAHSVDGQVTVPPFCTKDGLLRVYLTMYLKSLQSWDRFSSLFQTISILVNKNP